MTDKPDAIAVHMPGTNGGFTIAVFHGENVPVGTEIFAGRSPGRVFMPRNQDEAEIMQKLGYAWLKQEAPDRLINHLPVIRHLEWVKAGDHGRWTAQSCIGEYRIYVYTRSNTVELSCGPTVVASECTNVDDAKFRAQQHFETVISAGLL